MLDLDPQRETTTAVSLLSLGIGGSVSRGSGGHEKSKRVKTWKGKQGVIDGINEFIEELENIPLQIAQQGLDQLHANEVCNSNKTTILKTWNLGCFDLWVF